MQIVTTAIVLLSLLAADPAAEQLKLLKAFRDEFVAIKPSKSDLPPYSIAKYEVPQNLWQAVMGSNPGRWKGPRNSVEMIHRTEAVAFCRKAMGLLRAARLIEPNQGIR